MPADRRLRRARPVRSGAHHATHPDHPVAGDITPQALWQRRRTLAAAAGFVAADPLARLAALAATSAPLMLGPGRAEAAPTPALTALPGTRSAVAGALVMDRPTSRDDATGYNNYYEFGTDKSSPAATAGSLKTRPWAIVVDGEVAKPRTFDIDALMKLAPMEDRIYRLRCVEGWSMVIPWVGWSLSALVKAVEPTGNAKFVQFTTLADKAQMPGLQSRVLDWPYREGLRLDEAMHPLALLAFGAYGSVLADQNGAPVRLVVPWKYGFKSGKSIVRITFTSTQPRTAWNDAAPQEYGFYANVNPTVDHPRWSQATERRIGEDGLFARKRETLLFNGYAAQVGALYAGMDLARNY